MGTRQDQGTSFYMTLAKTAPVLSKNEEKELWKRWNQDRSDRILDRIVRSNLRYVVQIALKYRRYGVPVEDLVSEGNLGLVKAIQKFEYEQGNRFVTYASHWIRAYIIKYILKNLSLVGGSKAMRSKFFFKLKRERNKVYVLLGNSEEAQRVLAKRLGVKSTQLAEMNQRISARDVSLDNSVYEDSTTTWVETLEGSELDPEEQFHRFQDKEVHSDHVRQALAILDDRELFIVRNRIMVDPEESQTLEQLGQRFGVTRERARQIEARAKKKIKDRIKGLQ